MTYEQAFKIGSQCDGYIRCTYAKLHSPELGALFSFQRKGLRRINSAYNGIVDYFGEQASGKAYYDNNPNVNSYAQTNADAVVYITMELPLVSAKEHITISKENDLVPVRLTIGAKEYIRGILGIKKGYSGISTYRPYKTKYIVYRVYIGNKVTEYNNGSVTAGEKDVIFETFNKDELKEYNKENYKDKERELTHEEHERGWYILVEEIEATNPRIEELLTGLNNDSVFYVKACAIDWIPTNIENAVVSVGGQEIQLADALAEAKKKLEQAKALLATTATAAIVL